MLDHSFFDEEFSANVKKSVRQMCNNKNTCLILKRNKNLCIVAESYSLIYVRIKYGISYCAFLIAWLLIE